jgi:hypothetical protein
VEWQNVNSPRRRINPVFAIASDPLSPGRRPASNDFPIESFF